MRVFLSSVRRGLEEERDALRGLIRAAGHTPVLYEDFSAQNEPSREACLKALAESDVYLLLLGPNYGHRFPETGQSPTHEEWTTASVAGKRRIVYRKLGVIFEPAQQELARLVESYSTGVFRDSFETTVELMTKVTAKLNGLDSIEAPLDYQVIGGTLSVTWRADFDVDLRRETPAGPILELHMCPIGGQPYTSRVMSKLGDSLVDRVRRSSLVDAQIALESHAGDNGAVVTAKFSRPTSWNDSTEEQFLGLRLEKSGQVSLWESLPSNSMGGFLDTERLSNQLARLLRECSSLELLTKGSRVGVAAGVQPVQMLTLGTFSAQHSRTSARVLSTSQDPLRIIPDESVPVDALHSGASEIARDLARMLTRAFERRR